MRCSTCSANLSDGDKFCEECGAAALRSCPQCQHVSSLKAKFCSRCGANLLATSLPTVTVSHSATITSTASLEHRQLSIMFCDMVGSSALAVRLDPEEQREIVGAYQACCANEIKRFGGTIAQYLGDGVLAYFGHPAAHEDDAERAVHAGLAILDAVQEVGCAKNVTLQSRVGIASGLVLVGDLICGDVT